MAVEGHCCLFTFDTSLKDAEELVGHLCANGMQERTFLEQVRLTDKVLQIPFIEGTGDEQKDEIAVEEFS